ncbi:MAG: OadG family protein [Caldisericaceae bacterium]|nr:OadG family protein [Caldisericaceae bacterium]
MQFNTLGEGVLLGFLAMVGVFFILALIGAILFLFRLIFYREDAQVRQISQPAEITDGKISKKKVAAISAALHYYLNKGHRKITKNRRFSKNKSYEKLKIKRWKNG